MNIYICDDDAPFCERIKEICCEIAEKENVEYQLFSGGDGEQVLRFQEKIDILILDIDMPVVDGIQVKDRLEWQGRETYIIFVTNYPERMQEAFGARVLGFVDKGRMEAELGILLEKCIRRQQSYLLIKDKYDSRDILYIEAAHVYSKLYSRQGEILLVRESLADLEKNLESVCFVRVHRSYLVNMKYVMGDFGTKVCVGGVEIPVSIRLKKQAQEAYKGYCRKNARYY